MVIDANKSKTSNEVSLKEDLLLNYTNIEDKQICL